MIPVWSRRFCEFLSSPTLCDSIDCSLPGFSVHGIYQARILAAAAKSLQSCPTLCDPIHRRQPTRLPHPWDSLGKNTGVGCHFLLRCMKVKSESEAAQSCPTPSDPMDCSPPGSLRPWDFPGMYWSGVPMPSPGDLPNPGIEPGSPAL